MIRPQFDRFVLQENPHAVTGGGATGSRIAGEDMQHLIGELRAEATHLTTSGTSSHQDRALGRAFGLAADAVAANMRRHTNPAIADRFTAANAAFERLVRLEKAAGSVGSDAGVFTPAQFLAAIKSSDRSARKRAFARGESRMQTLGDDAKHVMGRHLNDSGTPERAALIGAILAPSAALPAAAMAAPLAAAYTRPGQWALRRLIAGGAGPRRAIADSIRTGAQRAAPAAAASDPVRRAVDYLMQSAGGR